MWCGGLKFANEHGVDCLVESTLSGRAIDVCVRAPDEDSVEVAGQLLTWLGEVGLVAIADVTLTHQ